MSVITDEVDALHAKIDGLIVSGEAKAIAFVKSIDDHIESLISVSGAAESADQINQSAGQNAALDKLTTLVDKLVSAYMTGGASAVVPPKTP